MASTASSSSAKPVIRSRILANAATASCRRGVLQTMGRRAKKARPGPHAFVDYAKVGTLVPPCALLRSRGDNNSLAHFSDEGKIPGAFLPEFSEKAERGA